MVSVDPIDVAVFIHESVVRGHHIYKETCTPSVGEILHVQQEPENVLDRRAMCLLKSLTIGARELSRVFGSSGNWKAGTGTETETRKVSSELPSRLHTYL